MLKDELPHLLYNKKHAANKDCTLCLSAVQMVQWLFKNVNSKVKVTRKSYFVSEYLMTELLFDLKRTTGLVWLGGERSRGGEPGDGRWRRL